MRPIGYGAMLLETLLGVCVVLAIAGTMSQGQYMEVVYKMRNPALGFALGVGNTIHSSLGISRPLATVFGLLLLEGFLITTIDTVIRLARYLAQECWQTLFTEVPPLLKSRIFNTVLVAGVVALVAFSNSYLAIWPTFGAANQLLAALTLITVTIWLMKEGRRYWFVALPAIFMTLTTLGALTVHLVSIMKAFETSKLPLVVADGVLFVLALVFIVMSGHFVLSKKCKSA
jgi:carbon starvation protein